MRSGLCTYAALGGLLLSLLAADSLGQGGGGRSGSADVPPAALKEARPSFRHITRNTLARNVQRTPAVVTVSTGSVAVIVNEGGSEVKLSRLDGITVGDTILTSPNASSLILRTLPVGAYSVQVTKAGFFVETRNVTIASGRRRNVRVNLRPKMSYLTVSTNVPDAQIEVENVGKFNRALRKYQIKPGKYQITAGRRGFLSQTATADLRIPGSEKDLAIVLEPVRIDSVLARSYEKINAAEYAAASDLANDVLKLNPSHAKANLLYGLTRYYRGDQTSAIYFLKAVKNGETMKLPVRILDEAAGRKLIDATLELDRDHLIFRTSSSRVDLNFRLVKPQISQLDRSIDSAFMTYIIVKGKGDTFGKAIEQRLMIYSPLAALRTDRKEIYCQTTIKDRSCSTDIDIIYKLLSDWRTTNSK